jgi:3-oxoacyl-[acyl-carrier protein] reductase
MCERGFGRIVALNSLYGMVSRRRRLPYAISKHALTGAIQTLALEVASYGVLVNEVSPGFIRTAMTEKNNSPERIKELESAIPLGRMGTGKDIAEVVDFLCSEKNTYITGQNIVVDGGYMAGGWQNA